MVWYDPRTWFPKQTVEVIELPAEKITAPAPAPEPTPAPAPSPAPTTTRGGGGGGGYTPSPFAKPITDPTSGELLGYEDPVLQQSIRATPTQKKVYKLTGGTSTQVFFAKRRAEDPAGITPTGVTVTEEKPALLPKQLSYSIAPSIKERFKQRTTTLSFLGQEAQSFITTKQFQRASRDPSYELYQPRATGRLASFGVQTLPYFTPISAPTILITGAEGIIRKPARAQKVEKAKYLEEQYKIPKSVSLTGQYALNVAMIFAGGRGSIKIIEKAFRLPKVTTVPIGFQQTTRLEAGKQKITTDVIFKSDIKRLLRTKTQYGVSRGITYAEPIKGGKVQLGETITGGYFAPERAGTLRLKQIKEFSAITQSYGFPIKGSKLSVQISGGRIAIGKPSEIYSFPKKAEFIGVGGAVKTPAKAIDQIFGRTGIVERGKILRQGVGDYEGLVFKVKKPSYPDIQYVSRVSKKSSTEFFNQLYKSSISIKSSIKFPTEVTKIVHASTSAVGLGQIPKASISFGVLGLQEVEVSKVSQIQFPKQIVKGALDTAVKTIQEPVVITKTRGRGRGGVIQAPIVIPKLVSAPKAIQIPKQIITPVQKLKARSKAVPIPSYAFPTLKFTTPFLLPVIPSLPAFGADEQMGKRRIKVKKVVRYIPSYSAIIYGITGKKPKGIETGLRVSPIPKGFSFAEFFGMKIPKKRKVRRR